MKKPQVSVRTKACTTLMSECVGQSITASDIKELLALFGDTIASYLSRGEVVHIDKLGTFYCNSRGWLRFLPSRRLKERTAALKEQRSRVRR